MSVYCQYCGKVLSTGDRTDRCFPDCNGSIFTDINNYKQTIQEPIDRIIIERDQLRAENERLRAVYPRAFKLMDKSKYFIVISFDEPYFIQAYSLIREQEIKIGRWNADDEAVYQYYAEQALKGDE